MTQIKRIRNIDEAARTYYRDKNIVLIDKPEESTGLLKRKIRIIKTYYVLIGKADAFTYSEQK